MVAVTSGWRVPPQPVGANEIAAEYTADIIVVGAGHAGTPAARAAAEAGASVIVIEKMNRRGFNVFGRDVGHINSKFLESRGVPKVDPIDFYNEWMRRNLNMPNPKLIMQFAKTAGETFDWFCEPFEQSELDQIDIGFWPLGKKFVGDITGYKFWGGTAQFAEPRIKGKDAFSMTRAVVRNQEAAEEHGARFHFSTEAMYPLLEGDRVAGLVAKNGDGKYVKYNASRAVILAAGGFGANSEMCGELLPDIADMLDEGESFRSMDRDGRGIQIGVWAGGRIEPRPLAAMGGNFNMLSGSVATFGTLWIGPDGKRYCNEMFGDTVFAGNANALNRRGTYTIIFDSNVLEALEAGPPAHMAFAVNDETAVEPLKKVMAEAVNAGDAGVKGARGGCTYAADSLEELADRIGFDAAQKANFIASVKRYNEMCANGRDEDFGKDPRVLFPIATPPYFAEPKSECMIGMMMVTCGGLLTDENQNVLNMKKEPIPGLYATGNCCGRRFGPQYSTPVAGVSIGICYALGRLAGIAAAAL